MVSRIKWQEEAEKEAKIDNLIRDYA